MFAMDHEDGTFISRDRFLRQGLKIMRQEKAMREEWEAEQVAHAEILETEREVSQDIGLLEGKLKREELKEELFTYLDSLKRVSISEIIERKNYS
jgi:Arc/MetJ-type ribon-helix-helix transcriptional regulator